MRIRDLNPKPTTFTGNPLMRTRWKTIYRNGDGCFTVNSGNNKRNGLDADFIRATTSFDIIANYDTGIPGADVAPWITGLPDGQVCFLCDVEPLQDINVMMQAYGQIDKNKNFNVSSAIVKASGVPGSRIVVSAACRHQLDNRNCATVRFASDAEPDTDVARVWVVAIVTGKEKEIMDLLNVGAFTALTAPYAAVPDGGASGLLHRADRAVLTLRRVTADETRESKRVGDQAHRQWFRGADGRTDLYRHGGRSAAFASMGQYSALCADDRHVFRDSHGHVIRRYPDEREESDHRGWRGHHARNKRMVVGRHIARQGRARDHTVHRMVQRRGLAYHASFARRLLRQGHGSILALGLGVAA